MENQNNSNQQESFPLKNSEEVCIIDDSSIPMAMTKKICQRVLPSTVEIKLFSSVDSAISYLTKAISKKRTIFLDLHMPEKDGWSFLNLYHPNANEVIFILSSSENETDFSKAKEYPVVKDYLVKPLTLQKIAQL